MWIRAEVTGTHTGPFIGPPTGKPVHFTVIDVATGMWALVDPHGWYDDFPGFGHHWVAGQGGTFNEHLASDAGAGFLAVGVDCVQTNSFGGFDVVLAEYGIAIARMGNFDVNLDEQDEEKLKGLASDTAAAVAFLCSDDAAYITGESMNVSGGEEPH